MRLLLSAFFLAAAMALAGAAAADPAKGLEKSSGKSLERSLEKSSGKSLERSLDRSAGKSLEKSIVKDKGGHSAHEATGADVAHAVFSEIEKSLIRDYLRTNKGEWDVAHSKSQTMPHGLAKRDELPPGLAQHVARWGTLPPGLEKRDLPYDLESRLPKLRPGLARKIVGNDVVLIERATGLVLDILEGGGRS